MEFDQILALPYEELVEYILASRGLSRYPVPSGNVWEILPHQVAEFLACVQLRDIQIGDFIVSRVKGVERDWAVALERIGEGDWIPITIGSTENGEEIVISYNRIENYCTDPINVTVTHGLLVQGDVVALNFDTFLRISLVLDDIKKERLIDEQRGVLNPEGKRRMIAALEVLYPNFAKSVYWTSWL